MAQCSRLVTAIAIAGCLWFSANAQVDSGTVYDAQTGYYIKGAVVTLKAANISATTNSNGFYRLAPTAVRFPHAVQGSIIGAPFFKQNILNFGVGNDGERVRINVYDVSGRRVVCLLDSKVASGNYQINPCLSSLASKIYFVKVQTGSQTAMVKMPLLNRAGVGSDGMLKRSVTVGFAKKSAGSSDTLVVTDSGYNIASKPVNTDSSKHVDFQLVSFGTHAGTIMFDQASYSGCQYAAAIIVEDVDLTVPTISVRIKSRADTVGFTVLLKQNSATWVGQYIDSIRFSINATDSTKQTIKVQQPEGAMGDSIYAIYIDSAPDTVDTTQALWSGNSGNVGPGASQYFGLAMPIIVNLNDPDLTDTVAYVTAKDSADTVGIIMTLHPVASSFGSYSGKLWVSTTGSSQDNGILKVFGKNILSGENVTLLYYDLTPHQVEQGSICTWFPTLGSLSTDSTAYHGLADTMAISLTDNDISLNKVVVQVKSMKDPTGFLDSLTFSGTSTSRVFSGKLGFSTTASQAAEDVIAVQSSDTITVTYTDVNPDSVVTRKVPWSAQ